MDFRDPGNEVRELDNQFFQWQCDQQFPEAASKRLI